MSNPLLAAIVMPNPPTPAELRPYFHAAFWANMRAKQDVEVKVKDVERRDSTGRTCLDYIRSLEKHGFQCTHQRKRGTRMQTFYTLPFRALETWIAVNERLFKRIPMPPLDAVNAVNAPG